MGARLGAGGTSAAKVRLARTKDKRRRTGCTVPVLGQSSLGFGAEAQVGPAMGARAASPDLEPHGGALFDQKGDAIEPSPKLADRAHVARFLAESEALIARTGA